jgi:hypothetical protein
MDGLPVRDFCIAILPPVTMCFLWGVLLTSSNISVIRRPSYTWGLSLCENFSLFPPIRNRLQVYHFQIIIWKWCLGVVDYNRQHLDVRDRSTEGIHRRIWKGTRWSLEILTVTLFSRNQCHFYFDLKSNTSFVCVLIITIDAAGCIIRLEYYDHLVIISSVMFFHNK